MKINIHTDQYIAPATTTPSRPALSIGNPGLSASDQLFASAAGSGISSTLNTIDSARAARVSQLASLYATGRYTVNSANVAQALVSGAFGG